MKEEYFVEVVQREKNLMFRLAYGILLNSSDAEDAVSEGIAKAWENQSSICDKNKMGAWLVKIVINEAKQMMKKRKREMQTKQKIRWQGRIIPMDEESILWQTVLSLSEDGRIVIILFYYKRYSIKEIAKILHKPEGTIKYLLSIARKELRLAWLGKEQKDV